MSKEPKDKRTKAWKEWKKNFDEQNSIGLGDVIEKVTKVTGIKKAVDTFTPEGKDCGCDEKKERLNNKYRLRHTLNKCFTEEQYNQWTEFINRERKTEVTAKQQMEIIIPIYAKLFAHNPKHFISKQKPSSCGSCVREKINDINKVYEMY